MRNALLLAVMALLAVPAFGGDAYVLSGFPPGKRPRVYNLNVTVPSGGEVYVVGQTQTLIYGGRPLLKNLLIELSRDGGTTWSQIGTTTSKHNGPIGGEKFQWVVTGPASANCEVRFSGMIGKVKVAVNSPLFSIGAPDSPPFLFTGPAGTDGDVGPIGPAGPQGPQGIPGIQGPKGDKGDAGDVGSMGPPGTAGENGGTGPAGPQGIKGDKGDAGPRGYTGDVGPAGPKGSTGGAGPQGPAGVAGAVGPAGPAGAVGPAGPAGAKGNTGAAGPQGPAGLQGPAGPACYNNGCFFGILVLTNTNKSHDERITDSRCHPGCIIHIDFDDTDSPCDDVITHKVRVYNGYCVVHLNCDGGFSLKHKLHYHVICP